MTGPNNPPPPGGPGRDLIDDDYALNLATVGCDVIDAIAEATAAAGPELTAEQRTTIARIFAGGSWAPPAPRHGHLPIGPSLPPPPYPPRPSAGPASVGAA